MLYPTSLNDYEFLFALGMVGFDDAGPKKAKVKKSSAEEEEEEDKEAAAPADAEPGGEGKPPSNDTNTLYIQVLVVEKLKLYIIFLI